MKNLIVLIALFATIQLSTAQSSGIISYLSTQKLEINMDDMPEGVDLSGMLPTSRSATKELIFNKNESVYIDGKEEVEDTEFTSDDGSFKMVIKESDVESKLYTNYKTKQRVSQEDFMGKAFVIEETSPKYNWKLTKEKIKFLGYECTKATTTNEEDEEIVAWFAPAIKTQAGPDGYGQLPGAILMFSLDDGKLEIKALKVELKEVDKIEIPNDGKKVTGEEYEKIVDEKMKEMAKEYGGNGMRIEIRG
jgi:GLPGLI family protein